MKKGNLLGCAMLVMCQLSLAQVSRDSAYAILKTDILDSTWIEKEIFSTTEVLHFGDTVSSSFGNKLFLVPYSDCWFFFVDEKPFANWCHGCKYVFINKETGDYVVNNSYYPAKGRHEMDLLNSVLPRKATDPKSLFRIPKSRNTTTSDN